MTRRSRNLELPPLWIAVLHLAPQTTFCSISPQASSVEQKQTLKQQLIRVPFCRTSEWMTIQPYEAVFWFCIFVFF